MFLLSSFLESMKNAALYLSIFQSSAGGSQAGATDLVQFLRHRAWGCASWRNFRGILLSGAVESCDKTLTVVVKI
jgi:hypothetical protein